MKTLTTLTILLLIGFAGNFSDNAKENSKTKQQENEIALITDLDSNIDTTGIHELIREEIISGGNDWTDTGVYEAIERVFIIREITDSVIKQDILQQYYL